MSEIDLTSVIEDAISDSTYPETDTSTSDTSYDSPVEDTTTEVEASTEASDSPVDETSQEGDLDPNDTSVASPAARNAAEDPSFDKKLGIPAQTNGRENRLPYSRVKKIVENAEKKAIEPLQAKLTELETTTKEYESRLQSVAQFEHVMLNEPMKFMEMLAEVPAYQGFFRAVQDLQARVQGQAQNQEQVVDNDPMPVPDEAQADGSAVYSMEGLKKLLDWQARQVEAKVTQRYRPIEQEWQAQKQLQDLIPQVERQIQEARTWPLFKENEDAITQVLQQNPSATLDAAYRHVVFPKLQANRDSMRASILAELNRAPKATSSPSSLSRPAAPVQSGPRSLEDVIAESLRTSAR